ncbi:MAG: 2-C-methyl-D-erythritol 4-phosphate cytidylyltransferase [Acidimicrobiales bacterium]
MPDGPAEADRPSGTTTWAVVVAGGSGARFGGYKQFMLLAGREVVEWSVEAAARACAGVVLVVPADWVQNYLGRADHVVAGGPTRAASVRAGLQVIPDDAQVVVVHDAVRPLAGPRTWASVIAAIEEGADGAVPCVPVLDTIKQRQDDGKLLTLERAKLVAVQTPQAFSAASLRAAHAGEGEATDDAALVEAMGGRVVTVAGEPRNIKVTAPDDLALAEMLLSLKPAPGAS